MIDLKSISHLSVSRRRSPIRGPEMKSISSGVASKVTPVGRPLPRGLSAPWPLGFTSRQCLGTSTPSLLLLYYIKKLNSYILYHTYTSYTYIMYKHISYIYISYIYHLSSMFMCVFRSPGDFFPFGPELFEGAGPRRPAELFSEPRRQFFTEPLSLVRLVRMPSTSPRSSPSWAKPTPALYTTLKE